MNLKKLLPVLFVLASLSASANYMLIQNVSKVGNNPTAKTIQIQFDISWQNSWRDSINYDAAWIFIKYKDASGLWQHAKLSLSGYQNGTGTANSLNVQSDSVGAYMYRNALGNGAFSSTGVQLQWNYGQYGITDVSAFEVRVFAIEMVYVPQGDFNVAKSFYEDDNQFNSSRLDSIAAPGGNFPVINTKLSPPLKYYRSGYSNYSKFGTYLGSIPSATDSIRIKGDAGIDTNNDGVIDNTIYPTGYQAFYCYKYELTEDQYADFYNTLTFTQQSAIGLAGNHITLTNGAYYSSSPNLACGNSTEQQVLSYASWCGMRPMTLLEFNKASYGPLQPVYLGNYISFSPYEQYNYGYPAWGSKNNQTIINGINNYMYIISTMQNVGLYASSTSSRASSGASYYGIMDLTGNTFEPVVKLNYFNFSKQNGNGQLPTSGNPYSIANWSSGMLIFIDQLISFMNGSRNLRNSSFQGFRYVRSAE